VKHIKVAIRGIAPILFNRWTEAASEALDKGTTGGKFTAEQRQEEALSKVYRNGQGLVMPAGNIKSCILQGASLAKLKEGRGSAVPYLRATLFIEPRDVPFGVPSPDGIHEAMGRRPPKKGGACLIRRPMLNEGWRLEFEIVLTDDRRDSSQIGRALAEAGLLAGLGDWRPDFGRFIVETFEAASG
jgi:hypothetical protein